MKPLLKILLLYFVFHTSFSFAQSQIKRTWHWYFGGNAGLDFSSGVPVAVTNGALFTGEGCATISDTSGNLLFYTDGLAIWNKNHVAMPNGSGLLGCATESSAQSALIVPLPGSNTLYYVFTTDCGENLGANGMRYSIVDMTLDGGLGDVITKNVFVFAPSSEKLTAVKNANGKDYWILTIKLNTNNFYAYKLNSSGLDTIPIISNAGLVDNNLGYLKPSPDGSKLAAGFLESGYTMELLDFSASTGVVSNPLYLPPSGTGQTYGVEFSPDGSKLYGSYPPDRKIYQYDLSAGTPTDIVNSATIIAPSSTSSYCALQMASDGKVYVARTSALGTEYSLGCINNPNLLGSACNYNDSAVSLGTGACYGGLPNFIHDNFFVPTSLNESEKIQISIMIYPNPGNGKFNLLIENSSIKLKEMEIVDVLGNSIYQNVIKDSQSFFSIDISDQINGIYFIKIRTEKQIVYSKIILSK